jgi:hypothetical protein
MDAHNVVPCELFIKIQTELSLLASRANCCAPSRPTSEEICLCPVSNAEHLSGLWLPSATEPWRKYCR